MRGLSMITAPNTNPFTWIVSVRLGKCNSWQSSYFEAVRTKRLSSAKHLIWAFVQSKLASHNVSSTSSVVLYGSRVVCNLKLNGRNDDFQIKTWKSEQNLNTVRPQINNFSAIWAIVKESGYIFCLNHLNFLGPFFLISHSQLIQWRYHLFTCMDFNYLKFAPYSELFNQFRMWSFHHLL